MLLVDHGIFRLIYPNRHRVSALLWRSSQPAPGDIRWAARNGIRTIVNLRGGREFGSWALQREACEEVGIRIAELALQSRAAPSREQVREAARVFAEIEYPALIHCKSGADRVGLASALYLILQEGRPAEEAARQLHWRFGHIRSGKTGILDAFFEAYAREGDGLDFLTWVETKYDPKALKASFRPAGWGSFLVDHLLRRE